MNYLINFFVVLLFLVACNQPKATESVAKSSPSHSGVKLPNDTNYISYTVQLDSQIIRTYWLGTNDEPMRHFNGLAGYVMKNQQTLVFGMNGGMYEADYSPVGLYIEQGRELHPIDSSEGAGNFYLLPNGVFSIDTFGYGSVVQTSKFLNDRSVDYATQSGPMLLIDGEIHSAFRQNSTNLNIRNGVGILPDGRIHLAMSKRAVNFYNFAIYFKSLGCEQALYLDGLVSRVYDSRTKEKGADGRFGVLIGVSEVWD